ncbi:MAG TPA: hypothetical protein VGI50_17140 [Solirubrobacteraceae bacterium]
MVGELIMLPVRVGVRATRLWFRAVEETFSITTSAAGRLIEVLGSGGSDGPPLRAPRASEPAPARPAPAREIRSAPAPVHVSEQPVLVEEFAEPGAEDGAGAEVHVNPPWDGYERMTAKQVIARLASADAAELAAVELYEATSRRRQTILGAAERELRRVNGTGGKRTRTQRG